MKKEVVIIEKTYKPSLAISTCPFGFNKDVLVCFLDYVVSQSEKDVFIEFDSHQNAKKFYDYCFDFKERLFLFYPSQETDEVVPGFISESERFRKEALLSLYDPKTKNIEDVNGRFVIPGLIDDQVHFREPGLTHKGDIATESKAGLAGGVTSYFEMPNVNPTTTTNENLTKKFELASTRSLSNYSFHLGGSNTNIEEIKQVDINQAAALKVFMGASTGEMLVDSIDALDDIFHYSPLTVVTHCEDPQRVKDNEKLFYDKYGSDLSAEHHHLIRDVESCYLSSSLAVDLAKKYEDPFKV